jgi:hypothetical protein
MTFTVAPLTSYTYVYIHVSHVHKLACTLHRTIKLLPLVCCTPTSNIYLFEASVLNDVPAQLEEDILVAS